MVRVRSLLTASFVLKSVVQVGASCTNAMYWSDRKYCKTKYENAEDIKACMQIACGKWKGSDWPNFPYVGPTGGQYQLHKDEISSFLDCMNLDPENDKFTPDKLEFTPESLVQGDSPTCENQLNPYLAPAPVDSTKSAVRTGLNWLSGSFLQIETGRALRGSSDNGNVDTSAALGLK